MIHLTFPDIQSVQTFQYVGQSKWNLIGAAVLFFGFVFGGGFFLWQMSFRKVKKDENQNKGNLSKKNILAV